MLGYPSGFVTSAVPEDPFDEVATVSLEAPEALPDDALLSVLLEVALEVPVLPDEAEDVELDDPQPANNVPAITAASVNDVTVFLHFISFASLYIG